MRVDFDGDIATVYNDDGSVYGVMSRRVYEWMISRPSSPEPSATAIRDSFLAKHPVKTARAVTLSIDGVDVPTGGWCQRCFPDPDGMGPDTCPTCAPDNWR